MSEYVGGGEVGALIAEIDAADRAEAETEREARRAEREAADREERRLAEWFRAGEAFADAAMLAAGFHKHRGQWRRRRDGEARRGEGDTGAGGGGRDDVG